MSIQPGLHEERSFIHFLFRRTMLKTFYWSRPWFLWAWGGLGVLLGLVYIQVELLVQLNTWYQAFYDHLQRAPEIVAQGEGAQGVIDFWNYIQEALWIIFPYIFIAVLSNFLSRHYTFRWRQAMSFTYIDKWQHHEQHVEGASQRIQEDTQRFARIVEGLGLEFFESVLKILAFVPILWSLSVYVQIPFFKGHSWFFSGIIAGTLGGGIGDFLVCRDQITRIGI